MSLSINQIISSITDFNKQIILLENKRTEYFIRLNELIMKNTDIIIYGDLSNLTKNITNSMLIYSLNIKDILNNIDLVEKEIKELKEFILLNKDWEGGKYLGEIIDTTDGCRIRFDEQSRSFKYQNYINSSTTIVCLSKEDCYVKAKKYLYDYYNNLEKIANQYKYIHPKYIEVKLPNGLTFITNSKFINIIENNKISSKFDKRYNNHYVVYLSDKREHTLLYKLLTNFSKVKHINGNSLDLREENLQEADNKVLSKINDREIEIILDENNKEIKPKTNKDGYEYDKWILGKYAGTVFERTGKKSWSVVVKKEDGSVVTKTLSYNDNNKDELYKQAVEIKNNFSDKFNLTRNKIKIISDDTIEVQLTQNQIMKTDYKYIDIIQKYNIYSTKSSEEGSKYYAIIEINGKMHKFHKHITGFDMVDHIDRDPLNNCLSNLRKSDHKLNNNNRSMSTNSEAVSLGVTYIEKDDCFRARIKQNNKEYSKQFSVKKYGYEGAKEMAINARKEMNQLFNCLNG